MIFDVYKFAKNLTPPRKKGPLSLAFIYALVDVIAFLRFIIFDLWISGSTDPNYSAGTYGLRDRVVYRLAVYESIVAGNTAAPDDITKWRKLQDSHVGTSHRVKYNGGFFLLQYALNVIFKTVWSGPTLRGEIYITNTPDSVGSFTIGISEEESSFVEPDISSEYIFETEISTDRINFTIFFPVAVYNALGTSADARESSVRSVVDRYVLAGLKYQIQTY